MLFFFGFLWIVIVRVWVFTIGLAGSALASVVGWWIRMLVIQACLDGVVARFCQRAPSFGAYNPECD